MTTNKNIIIGITERGDAGIDFSWVDKIQSTAYSVVITKNTTTERFHKAALENASKILLHATVTGWGGTPMEPNVPSPEESVASVTRLVTEGFPAEQIVWRIDPIVPANGELGLKAAHRAFRLINESKHIHNITRIRVSVVDGYAHSLRRMAAVGIKPNFSQASWNRVNDMLRYWEKQGFTIEACAEPKLYASHTGCVNMLDAQRFGVDIANLPINGQKRSGCLCSTAKTELLTNRKQCPHKCAYCYWR